MKEINLLRKKQDRVIIFIKEIGIRKKKILIKSN